MSLCWRAAYNEGYGAWVLDESLKGKATFVTEAASYFNEGVISSAQKVEGLGIAGRVRNGCGMVRSLSKLKICGQVCVRVGRWWGMGVRFDRSCCEMIPTVTQSH